MDKNNNTFSTLAPGCNEIILFVGNGMLKQHCRPTDRESKAEELKKDGFMTFNNIVFVHDTREDMMNAIRFLSDVYVNHIDSHM